MPDKYFKHQSAMGIPYTFNDYLLVMDLAFRPLSPAAHVLKATKASKAWAQPHISLCRFLMPPGQEASLKKELRNLLKPVQSSLAEGRPPARGKLMSRPGKPNMLKLRQDLLAAFRKRLKTARSITHGLRASNLDLPMAYNERQFQRSWMPFSRKPNYTMEFESLSLWRRPYAYTGRGPWNKLFQLPLSTA